MRTLDRYVVRSFLHSAAMLFVAIIALRIVADLFLNMDEFAETEQGLAVMARNIASYYSYQSLLYFAELGGVIIVAAAAFTLARMNHTNELTAMLASGVSLYRVIVPIVICAMLLGGLVILDREILIPPNAARLVRNRDEAEEISKFPVRLMTDTTGAVWFSPEFVPKTQTMVKPTLLIRDERYRMVAGAISAGVARPAKLDDVGGWDISDASLSRAGPKAQAWANTPSTAKVYTDIGPVRLLSKAKELAQRKGVQVPPDEQIGNVWGVPAVRDPRYGMTIASRPPDKKTPQLALDPVVPGQMRGGRLSHPTFTFRTDSGKLIAVLHADSATWVPDLADKSYWQLEAGRLFRPSDLTGEDLVLRQSSRWLDFMSSAQLSKLLKLGRVGDRTGAELAKHVRLADPINNLVMLLLGLPFILSRERNIKASAALCLLMVSSYFVFIYICRLLGLHPMVAAFLPIGLFGTVAVVMLDSIKT